jgi:hypothetical protein
MKTHVAHVDMLELQKNALATIFSIMLTCPRVNFHELMVFCVGEGVLDAALNVLKTMRCRKDPPMEILRDGIHLLSAILQNGTDDSRTAAVQFLWSKEAVSVVLSSFTSFVDMNYKYRKDDLLDAAIHSDTCSIIRMMYDSPEPPAEPDLDVLVSDIKTNMHSSKRVSDGLHTLCLAVRSNKENGRILGKQFLGVVFEALNKHQDDMHVLDFGLLALCVMSQSSPKLQAYITQRGSVQLALDTMDKHAQVTGILEGCMGVLADLLKEQNTALTAEQLPTLCKQAFSAFLKAVSQHPNADEFANKTCARFSEMSSLPFFADVLHEVKGAQFFIRCIKTHRDNRNVLWKVYTMLRSLIEKHKDVQDVCAELGAIDAVIQALSKNKHDEPFLLLSRALLVAMTKDHERNTAYLTREMSGSKAKLLQNVFKCGACVIEKNEMPSSCRCCHVDKATWDQTIAELKEVVQCKSDILDKVVEERERLRVTEPCACCGKTAAMCGLQQLRSCSACTIGPKYCSVACQRASWGAHKAECKANRHVD